MRLRRGFWLWLLGLPLFLGTAAHWGFHFLVAHRLQEEARRLEPLAEFRYTGLETSLLGRVVVSGVSLRPRGAPAPLELAQVELEGPSPFSYLLRNNPLTGFGAPRFLRVRVPEMALSLEHWPSAPGDGCDLEKGIPAQTLRALGFSRLTGAFSARYRYLPAATSLEGEASMRLEGMENLSLEWQLENVTEEGFRRGQLGTALLAMLVLKVGIRPTFGRDLVEYCAGRRQLTPAAYRHALVGLVMNELKKRGVVPGPDLESALERYVENWGSLEFDLVPPVPMSLAFLPFVPLEQLHEKLGFQVVINGEAVKGLRLGGRLARPAPASGQEKENDAGRRLRLQPAAPGRWLYRRVSPSSLGRYLGHRVRLQEKGRPVLSGILVEVSDGQAAVEQRLRGGKFIAYLPLNELASAEVYLPGRVPDKK